MIDRKAINEIVNKRIRNILLSVVIGICLIVVAIVVFLIFLYRSADRSLVYQTLAPSQAAFEIVRLEVTDTAERVVWSIENSGSTSDAPVVFGVLPRDFLQLFPANVRPRQPEFGECLLVSYTTNQGWARHNVWARSDNRFRFGITTSGRPPLPENEMFKEPGKNAARFTPSLNKEVERTPTAGARP